MTETQSKRKYRISFILDTRGVEESIDDLVGKLTEAVRNQDGDIETVENLGRKDFGRVTVPDHTGDYYIRIVFQGPRGAPQGVRDVFRLDKTVKRVFVESVGAKEEEEARHRARREAEAKSVPED